MPTAKRLKGVMTARNRADEDATTRSTMGSRNPSWIAIEDVKGLNQKGRGELVDFLLRKLQDFSGGNRSLLDQHSKKHTV